ncbi:RDD family protein [Chitinophaga lutea]
MHPVTEENILSHEVVLTQASTGQRFANYLIDSIVFYVFIIFVVFFYVATTGVNIFNYEDTAVNDLLDRLVSMILYGLLFGLIEGVFKGKTLGKVITGTRAVNADGTPISFGTAFLRGLVRIIPFDALSALGTPSYPWHDRWTKTMVVDMKKSILPEKDVI